MNTDTTDALEDALCRASAALERDGVDALVVGGIAISYHLTGEPKVDHDVDLFIRRADLDRAEEVLAADGFEVVRTHPTWLFKARLDGATVDVLYILGRVLELDDEMLRRAVDVRLAGCSFRAASREDLAVGQAGAARSEVPTPWFQAVDLLRDGGLDWSYLAMRGATAPDRFAALLHFARSEGLDVPALD